MHYLPPPLPRACTDTGNSHQTHQSVTTSREELALLPIFMWKKKMGKGVRETSSKSTVLKDTTVLFSAKTIFKMFFLF